MLPDRWKLVRPILDGAMELPPGERTAFLDQACAGDAELEAEVRALIALDRGAGLDLPTPASLERAARRAIDFDAAGARIGPFQLEERIAVGGMGEVWRARRVEGFAQVEGLEQTVAIKLIKVGMDTREMLRRFANERALLAGLQHDGITRLFDGGADERGRPYVVMEFVDGVPIDRYCSEHALAIRERIALFLAVCDAVRFAHERHIVHRDIKPSNILVARDGRPKLLDFGIAKVLSADGDDPTAERTLTSQRVMTPGYASPEQLAGERLTTTSDVYSLGVVLWELCVGQRAFTGERTPVQAVQTASVALARRTGSRRSAREIAGDLDTILATACHAEPGRRYPSVDAFAADLRRFLADQPIRARRDSVVYRVSKFTRRNRLLVGSLATMLVALSIATAVGWNAYVRGGAAPATDAAQLEHSRWFVDAAAGIQRAEYRFAPVPGETRAWTAPNRSQELRTRVSDVGVEVSPREQATSSWTLTLGTSSFGREGDDRTLFAANVGVEKDRAELDHGPITESFANDKRGLEHGWTIAEKPRGTQPLWIGLAMGGDLRLRIDAGERSGDLVDAEGEVRLRYTGLEAIDAAGRELDARLTSISGGVGIRVDDARATYPVTLHARLTGPAWTADGNQAGANFGLSVAPAGDVNGDGFGDVIVGAYAYDRGEADEGAAFVYLGSSSGLASTPSWAGEGNQISSGYGTSVATAGDVNGDGFSDVIVGAIVYTHDELREGRAFVYFGSSSGLSPTPGWTADGDQEFAFFGRSVATAGDVNGDGFSDVIVGVQDWQNGEAREGRACLYYGSSTGLTPSPVWTMEGDQVEALFGWSVATAGDVNGDGYDDFLVGAYRYDDGETDEGCAFLFLGSPTVPTTSAAWKVGGDQVDADFGVCVASAGDVNADGYGDVIVGARLYDNGETNEGRAFLFLGSSLGLSTTPAWTAESDQANSQYAYSVAGAGDFNGDGRGDVLVGAYDYDNGETGEGKAWLFLGTDSGLETIAAWTSEGNQTSAGHGVQVATAGDVNGDGRSDAIVGSYWYDNGQTDEGRAYVYFGRSLPR